MSTALAAVAVVLVALRKESVDRNFFARVGVGNTDLSLSARRAWIEILIGGTRHAIRTLVALRKESVDRNARASSLAIRSCVALRKESVDRNLDAVRRGLDTVGSLSARRAWIEIHSFTMAAVFSLVALRKESVDRNYVPLRTLASGHMSLSARRAWIEIVSRLPAGGAE